MRGRYKSNGPVAYSRVIKAFAELSPVHFAYAIQLLHNGINSMYENREARLQEMKNSNGNPIVNPEWEMVISEDLKLLIDIASQAANGDLSPSKVNYLEELRKTKTS